jgi:hypothetical protein
MGSGPWTAKARLPKARGKYGTQARASFDPAAALSVVRRCPQCCASPYSVFKRWPRGAKSLRLEGVTRLHGEPRVRSSGKRLICKEVPGWPKLAWVAVTKLASDTISVLHGPCVETNPDWCVEAVWAGDFSAGNFDLVDVIAGTGVRLRGDDVLFVSSGDTLNRLHNFNDGEKIYVSNSLSVLMAVASLAFVSDYDYAPAMESIKYGLVSYVRQIPSMRGPICLTYFDNLLLSGSNIERLAKASSAPDFIDFATYRDYLFDSARRIGENARAPERRHSIKLVATVSSGYDSPAAAVLAREAGAREAVTIAQARRAPQHILSINDSGVDAARQLGMSCQVYSRTRKSYPFEDALWSSMGNVGDINMAIFDYPEELCSLFTGFVGDVLWDKDARQIEPLRRKDTSGARFSECRLELGVFNCSPAFWGCRNEGQICALSRRSEMLPWTLGTDYDRPIPRRLAEEAGITRDSFGTRKRLSSFARRYGRPLSPHLREDFARFLEVRGERAISGFLERLSLVLRGFDSVILSRLPRILRFSCAQWIPLPSPSLFFIWANERRKYRYRMSLAPVDPDEDRSWAPLDPGELRGEGAPPARAHSRLATATEAARVDALRSLH